MASRGSCTRSGEPGTSSAPSDPPRRLSATPVAPSQDGRPAPARRFDLRRVDWRQLEESRPQDPGDELPRRSREWLAATRLARRWRDAVTLPIARLPIRVRLAGGSAALTLLILCMFALAIGTLTARRIRADFTSQLTTAADNIGTNVRLFQDEVTGDWHVDRPLDFLAAPDHAKVLIIGTSSLSPLVGTIDVPYLGPPVVGTADVGPYRVVTRLVRTNIGPELIQYARPVSDLDKTIGRLQVFLIFGVLAGTGLAFAAGSMIARRAMAPIAALTAAASEVQRTRDPSRGVPGSQSEDEVAELGRTLEGMLHALSSARAETEAMLDRQRAFVADASHELRTPLTSVLANLELLSETLRGEEASAAESALRSSRRMRRLVEDLLLLARADVGRERINRPFDLAAVVVEAASELGPLSAGHVVELDARRAPMTGVRDDVQRVATNLLENALRHTPRGTHVTVSTRAVPGGGAVLCVSDNGPGIAPELAPRLFERFVRGSGDRGGSVGLGLAIVAAVAEAHDGGVSVEETPGGGARFVVHFGQGGGPAAGRPAEAKAGTRAGIRTS